MTLIAFPCFALVLLMASIAVLTLLIAGRRDPARPRCAACRVEVPPIAIMQSEPCPHCRTSLSGERALLTTRRNASRATWLTFGGIVLLWPSLILLPMAMTRAARNQTHVAMPQASRAATATSEELTKYVINERSGVVTATSAFTERALKGDLDLDATRAALLLELPVIEPTTITQPQPGALTVAEVLLKHRADDAEVMDAILTAFQPTPVVRIAHTFPDRIVIQIDESPRGGGAGRTLQPTLVLRAIRAGDRSIPFITPSSSTPQISAMVISDSTNSVTIMRADLGEATELSFEFDAMLFDWFDAQRARSINAHGGSAEDWPRPMHTHQRQTTLRLNDATTP